MALPAWAAAAIPSAISGIAGLFGQERANRTNIREAAKNRAFQSSQAQRQMDFQERMRNTSWQAAISDMEAAGLNPALAYSQGGAQVPGGASGGGSLPAAAQDIVSSALQAAQATKTLRLMGEQIRRTQAEADSAKAKADIDLQRRHLLLNLEGGQQEQLLRTLVKSEVEGVRAGASNMAAQAARAQELTKILGPMAGLSERFGELLPILSMLMLPGGPASALAKRGIGGVGARKAARKAADSFRRLGKP